MGAEDPTKKEGEQSSQKRGREEQRREPHRKRQRSRAKRRRDEKKPYQEFDRKNVRPRNRPGEGQVPGLGGSHIRKIAELERSPVTPGIKINIDARDKEYGKGINRYCILISQAIDIQRTMR